MYTRQRVTWLRLLYYCASVFTVNKTHIKKQNTRRFSLTTLDVNILNMSYLLPLVKITCLNLLFFCRQVFCIFITGAATIYLIRS